MTKLEHKKRQRDLLTFVQVSWDQLGQPLTANWETNLSAITKYSPITTMSHITHRFESIGAHGTLIIVFNLKRLEDTLELDFTSNLTGISYFILLF